MDEREMMGVVESILFISGEPVTLSDIAGVLKIDKRLAKNFMEKMIDIFNYERRGLQIIKVNESYQLATRPEYAEYIEGFITKDKKQTLSQAALETLSIVAYCQPVTRMDVEKIRGVKCEHSLAVLINRGLIKEVGRMDVPGRPIFYGTTDLFLRNFGLSSLEDLPPLEKTTEIE